MHNPDGSTSDFNLGDYAADCIVQLTAINIVPCIVYGVLLDYSVTQPDNSLCNISNYKKGMFRYIY